MIRADAQATASGISALRVGTEDFDATLAAANPSGGDLGAAAAVLADVLALTTDIALRLVVEVDTITDAVQAAVDDLGAMEDFAKARVSELGAGLQ